MASRIQQLNGAFRTSLSADLGRIVMIRGVACVDFETIALIPNAVRTSDEFDEDIDPYGEQNMGRFTVSEEECLQNPTGLVTYLWFFCSSAGFCAQATM